MTPFDLIGEVLDHSRSLRALNQALVIFEEPHPFQPSLKFRCRPFPEHLPNEQRVMEGGALVGQHDVITPRDSHDVVTSGYAEQGEEVVHVVLVGLGMVGVANVTPHGKSEQLSAKMILKTCPDDLFGIIKIFRADKAYDRIDQQRRKFSSDGIGSGFKGLCIHAMMGIG